MAAGSPGAGWALAAMLWAPVADHLSDRFGHPPFLAAALTTLDLLLRNRS
jgi:MFS family permease